MDFLVGCALLPQVPTPLTLFSDSALPLAGEVFYYLVQSKMPHPGRCCLCVKIKKMTVMQSISLFVVFIAYQNTVVLAESNDARPVAKCAAIEAPLERLECFDDVV